MPAQRSWEDEAQAWVTWVRTPGHDIFPYYAPSFFDEIVPSPRGRTLEIGCGEGRVAREMRARAHDVVALDGSPTLLRFAREADAGPAYLAGHGPLLPFADASFDTVIAYNSLQTMALLTDMAETVREAARVLKPGGCLCLCVAHPATDVVRIAAQHASPDATEAPSYFEHHMVDDTVTKNGLTMNFHGWTYTLEDYTRAFEDAGFVIERLREPLPEGGDAASRKDLDRWRGAPLFLFIRARKT
jgi:SAM-dependent methyltransferase